MATHNFCGREYPVATSPIMIDGVRYATPLFFYSLDGQLFGWYLPEEGEQYCQEYYWGEDTPEHRKAIALAGVVIVD